jgi:hypothetical protein
MALNEADIAQARKQLDRAIESLAAAGVAGTGLDDLREAARLLEGLRLAAVAEPPAPALAPALRDLQARAARLGQLFDSAAAFYRGWFQVSPPAAEGYTPEGIWSAGVRSGPGGALSLEA